MEDLQIFKGHSGLVKGLLLSLKDIFIGGYYSDKVLERRFKENKKWGARDRRFLAETVYNMTRWWGLLTSLASIPLPSTDEDFAFLWALYEARFNKLNALPFLKTLGFKEALLEKALPLAMQSPLQEWDKVSFPRWLFEAIKKDFPDHYENLLLALNAPAPVTLRTNELKTTRQKLIKLLFAENIEVEESKVTPEGLFLSQRQNVFVSRSFKEGLFEVQDESSQRVAPLLDAKPGERIADVCAGAGGKTLHLAALMKNKGTLLACDVSERKLEELRIRARRAGVSNLRVQLVEGTKSLKRFYESFDGVLIDAPCTGVGVIRRNPDTKWKINEDEWKRLQELQREILDFYSRLVKSGGRLVYATCSLLRPENEEQIQWFLESHPNFRLEGRALKTNPLQDQGDGFFAQLMLRK